MKTWKIVALFLAPPFAVLLSLILFSTVSFVAGALVGAAGTVHILTFVNLGLGLLALAGLAATPICWIIAIVALIRRK